MPLESAPQQPSKRPVEEELAELNTRESKEAYQRQVNTSHHESVFTPPGEGRTYESNEGSDAVTQILNEIRNLSSEDQLRLLRSLMGTGNSERMESTNDNDNTGAQDEERVKKVRERLGLS